MQKTNWKKGLHDSYFSHHILVAYLGEKVPVYHILKNEVGDGWVLGSYNTFSGEYTAVEDVNFDTLVEAKNYVDVGLRLQRLVDSR